jgi:hypothetical protein
MEGGTPVGMSVNSRSAAHNLVKAGVIFLKRGAFVKLEAMKPLLERISIAPLIVTTASRTNANLYATSDFDSYQTD